MLLVWSLNIISIQFLSTCSILVGRLLSMVSRCSQTDVCYIFIFRRRIYFFHCQSYTVICWGVVLGWAFYAVNGHSCERCGFPHDNLVIFDWGLLKWDIKYHPTSHDLLYFSETEAVCRDGDDWSNAEPRLHRLHQQREENRQGRSPWVMVVHWSITCKLTEV